MRLKELEITGFKSFAKKSTFVFDTPITAIVGPNGSGKSNVAEAIRFVLGEQSMKSMRGKRGEDLIWNGSQKVGRANHAAVSLTFDNSGREMPVAFDTVTIRREVLRDGTNNYLLNGSPVRLRDITELLSAVHIGASGHHIISQGEADRILSARPTDRKEILEEALALKVYHWKIAESRKKLSETREHIKEAESLRRELAPHLKYLGKQVERIEEAKKNREELADLYREYLKREERYLEIAKKQATQRRTEPAARLKTIEGELAELRAHSGSENVGKEEEKAIGDLEAQLQSVREKRQDLSRQAGKLEGVIEYERRRTEREEKETVPAAAVRSTVEEIETYLEDGQRSPDSFTAAVEHIRGALRRLRGYLSGSNDSSSADADALEKERAELERVREQDRQEAKEEETLLGRLEETRRKLEERRLSVTKAEKEILQRVAEQNELSGIVRECDMRLAELERQRERFEEEIREAIVLVGRSVSEYRDFEISDEEVENEPREKQESRRKKIERLKIKLEDMGVGGVEETMKEYEDTSARDQYLEKEIADLRQAAESLEELSAELKETLQKKFASGLQKINDQFSELFSAMFGGGNASLVLVKQPKRTRAALSEMPEETEESAGDEEEGVDIKVNVPRKKIRDLMMLSGGERALTSIALIFAMSQVNPPPFLVLDETDATLDEANSRRYGDMIENLAKSSQLIVITHNRETMSRAGVLYGVTMTSDAVSQLLSVKFDEAAAQYAK